MSQKSSNAPLKRVICQFRFSLNQENPWTDKKPGELMGLLKKDYPNFKADQSGLLNIHIGSGKEISHQILPTVQKYRYENENKSLSVTISSDSFLFQFVNDNNKYISWDKSFIPLLKKSWNTVSDCLSINEINSMGVRYINHIDLNEELNTDDVLNKDSIYVPSIITINNNSKFFNRTELAIDDKNLMVVNIGAGHAESDQTKKIIILDIDKILRDKFNSNDLFNDLSRLQKEIEVVFFNTISKKLKDKILQKKKK